MITELPISHGSICRVNDSVLFVNVMYSSVTVTMLYIGIFAKTEERSRVLPRNLARRNSHPDILKELPFQSLSEPFQEYSRVSRSNLSSMHHIMRIVSLTVVNTSRPMTCSVKLFSCLHSLTILSE